MRYLRSAGACAAAFLAVTVLLAVSSPVDAQDTTIRASIQSPSGSLLSKGFDWLLDEIERETDGRIAFERYYSGSLAKANEQLRATSSGLAGISLTVPSYVPAQLPLANVGSNPAMWVDSWVGSKAYDALYDHHPALREELDGHGVKLISALTTPTYHLVGRDVDLDSLDQLDGMRVMTSGQIAVLLESLGAQVVNVSTPEGYEALQRGTVDGAVYGLTSATTYGIEEVVESLWRIPLGGLPMLIIINQDVWESIPEQDQEIVERVAAGHPEAFHEIYQIGGDEASLETFREAGVKVNEPDEEDLADLNQAARKIWDQWAAEQQAAGRPGEEILQDFVQRVESLQSENPYASQ